MKILLIFGNDRRILDYDEIVSQWIGKKRQVNILTARSGEEGLKFLRKEKVDQIIIFDEIEGKLKAADAVALFREKTGVPIIYVNTAPIRDIEFAFKDVTVVDGNTTTFWDKIIEILTEKEAAN